MTASEQLLDGASGTPIGSGLCCLRCEYNLTGLSGDRCPECGMAIDWRAVREQRLLDRVRIGTCWQRWRWYLKPLGFVATALTAAFLPWRLGRQMRSRRGLLAALTFLAVCMAVPTCIVLYRAESHDDDILRGWMSGVLCQITLQTLILGLLFRPAGLRRALHFWLLVSCYTSYPLLVEYWTGMPCIGVGGGNIWPLMYVLGGKGGDPVLGYVVATTIVYHNWLAGLTVIAAARLPKRRWRAMLLPLVVIPLTCASSHFGAWASEWWPRLKMVLQSWLP